MAKLIRNKLEKFEKLIEKIHLLSHSFELIFAQEVNTNVANHNSIISGRERFRDEGEELWN